MTILRHNLHIHSNYSDGKNSIKKIVERSLKLELYCIAITDHFTDSWKTRIINTLDSENKINSYLEDISKQQDYLIDQNKKLKLFKGIEIDLESSENYIKQLIQPKKFDIILFEYLEGVEGIKFIQKLIEYWKNQKIIENYCPILGLAHFDPSFFIHGELDKLITFLKNYTCYFEFNSRYSEFYSRKYEIFFKKLKENNIPVAIGSDSHSLRRLDDIGGPIEMVQYYGLQKNLEFLHFKLKASKETVENGK